MISDTSGDQLKINNKSLLNPINNPLSEQQLMEVLKKTTSPHKKNEYNLSKEGEVFDKNK